MNYTGRVLLPGVRDDEKDVVRARKLTWSINDGLTTVIDLAVDASDTKVFDVPEAAILHVDLQDVHNDGRLSDKVHRDFTAPVQSPVPTPDVPSIEWIAQTI